jgi:hypothetical protein
MDLIGRRAAEFAGILLVGDGVIGALRPERHARLWLAGPRVWREAMEPFAERPRLTRAVGVAEIALGLWLAARAEPSRTRLTSERHGRTAADQPE